MKRRGIILGLAGVGVVGLAVAHMAGIFPPKSGLEGTIGAAKRYASRQISDRDVKLTDQQLQAFVQSDLFHKLATNAEFKKFWDAEIQRFAKVIKEANIETE